MANILLIRENDSNDIAWRPTMKDLDLTGLVSARICHDLASPIGALVNGADLISELEPGTAADELALVAQSARRAAAILKFHRLAFGSTGDAEARMSHRELHSRVEQVLTSPRVSLEWEPAENGEISVPAARLAALMLLTARAALGRGGVLAMIPGSKRDLSMVVRATGPQIRLTNEQRRYLAGDLDADLPSRQVEFALMVPVARHAGAQVRLDVSETALTLEAAPV
ncbi:MAG: histidine phosphotransferase family protein [Paracoccaceae bacterium]|nr:histidine phosphotransferase family protein [Paracoccaceae bacterium]